VKTHWVNEGKTAQDTSPDDFSSHEFNVEAEGPLVDKQEDAATEALKELQERPFDIWSNQAMRKNRGNSKRFVLSLHNV